LVPASSSNSQISYRYENKHRLGKVITGDEIFELTRFGGIGGSTVRKRLNLEKYFEDKPHLKEAIGKVGVHKVALLAKTLSIDLDEEMTFIFLKFKKKFKNLSNKEVMRKLLEQINGPAQPVKLITGDETPKSRYIPVALRRVTIGNGQCQYPNCNRPSDQIHHPERFAKVRNHKGLVALCKDHHEFMHNGLIENEAHHDWAMNVHKKPDQIDLLYRKYR